MYGDNREHLHNLYLPIQKCVEWFWNEKHSDMIYMFNNAIIGLKMLKYSYNEYATIQHTIDYYIIIMMQKSQKMTHMSVIDLDVFNSKIKKNLVRCIHLFPKTHLLAIFFFLFLVLLLPLLPLLPSPSLSSSFPLSL